MIPTLTPKKENWISVIAANYCRASSCDRCNLPCRPFAEPDVAVGARSDESWIAQGRGKEVSKLATGSDAGDHIAIGKSEPKITIRPHRDREGLAASRMGKLLELGGLPLGGNAWEVGEPTQSASRVRPRVNLGPNVWRKAANIARADSAQ